MCSARLSKMEEKTNCRNQLSYDAQTGSVLLPKRFFSLLKERASFFLNPVIHEDADYFAIRLPVEYSFSVDVPSDVVVQAWDVQAWENLKLVTGTFNIPLGFDGFKYQDFVDEDKYLNEVKLGALILTITIRADRPRFFGGKFSANVVSFDVIQSEDTTNELITVVNENDQNDVFLKIKNFSSELNHSEFIFSASDLQNQAFAGKFERRKEKLSQLLDSISAPLPSFLWVFGKELSLYKRSIGAAAFDVYLHKVNSYTAAQPLEITGKIMHLKIPIEMHPFTEQVNNFRFLVRSRLLPFEISVIQKTSIGVKMNFGTDYRYFLFCGSLILADSKTLALKHVFRSFLQLLPIYPDEVRVKIYAKDPDEVKIVKENEIGTVAAVRRQLDQKLSKNNYTCMYILLCGKNVKEGLIDMDFLDTVHFEPFNKQKKSELEIVGVYVDSNQAKKIVSEVGTALALDRSVPVDTIIKVGIL
jgi:hypothetical protein